MMRLRMVAAAMSMVLAPTLVSCSSTEPPADSPLTGEWVSANDPWVPSLDLDLSEGEGGEVSGSFTTSLGAWRLQGMVEGAYAHPEVRLTLKHQPLLEYGRYVGRRVDHNTIDGNFEIGSFDGEIVATRLKRKPREESCQPLARWRLAAARPARALMDGPHRPQRE